MFESLGDQLKIHRRGLKMTAQNVADYLGIARSTYTGYESNYREPDNDTLTKLADLFQTTVDNLLGRKIELMTKHSDVVNLIREKFPQLPDDQIYEQIRLWNDIVSLRDKHSDTKSYEKMIEDFLNTIERIIDVNKEAEETLKFYLKDEYDYDESIHGTPREFMDNGYKTKEEAEKERLILQEENKLEAMMSPPRTITMIPIVAEIPCGPPIYTEENVIGTIPLSLEMFNLRGSSYIWLRTKGESMVNVGIYDGSYVLIRIQPEVDNGDIAAICVDEENATLKRFFVNGDKVTLIPENPSMDKLVIESARVRVVGKHIGTFTIRS